MPSAEAGGLCGDEHPYEPEWYWCHDIPALTYAVDGQEDVELPESALDDGMQQPCGCGLKHPF